MVFHNLTDPGSGVDIEQIVVRSAEPLDRGRLEISFNKLLDVHEVLRAGFDAFGADETTFDIADATRLIIAEQDFESEDALESALATHLAEERRTGFALDNAPLMRVRLLQHEQGSVVLWTFHHLLLDGRTFAPLLDELFSLYNEPGYSPDARPRFREFATWLQGYDIKPGLAFWRSYLEGLSNPCVFPTLTQERSGKRYGFLETRLSRDQSHAIADACRELGVSVNILLQAAWAALLHRYTGETDVVFGATYTTRYCEFPEAADIIGLMINTLPVRMNFAGQERADEIMHALSQHAKDVRPHVLSPLNAVQQQADVSGDLPLFDTVVVFDRLKLGDSMRQRRPDLSHLDCEYVGQTNFPLALIAYGGDEISLATGVRSDTR